MSSIPGIPSSNDPSALPTSLPNAGTPTSFGSTSSASSGQEMWIKFLSTPGHPATAKEADQWVSTLFKQLSQQIAHELARAKKMAEKEKRAATGRD